MRVLAIDGGRTGCRARLRAAGDDPVEATGRPLPHHGEDSVEAVMDALQAVVTHLDPMGQPPDVVVAGLAGFLGQPEQARALGAGLARATGAQRVCVTGDLVTSHAGALALSDGVVVAAGTGAVAFAVGPGGRTARVDGWGYLLGDEGSGFWIGRRGLAAALAHEDGRGGSAELQRRAEAMFGPIEQVHDAVHRSTGAVAAVARFAPEIADAAHAGDEVARRIWADAGRSLAATTAAAAARALPDAAGRAAWTGGLFAAGELLLGPYTAELARRCPRLVLTPPAGTALDGAELLATLAPLPAHLGHEHRAEPDNGHGVRPARATMPRTAGHAWW